MKFEDIKLNHRFPSFKYLNALKSKNYEFLIFSVESNVFSHALNIQSGPRKRQREADFLN